MAQAIGRWGNYFNQELIGKPSSLPRALRIAAAYTFGRFFTEYERIDFAHRLGPLRLNDWTSVVVFTAALATLVVVNRSASGARCEAEAAGGVPCDDATVDASRSPG